jgi:hypothetical protein
MLRAYVLFAVVGLFAWSATTSRAATVFYDDFESSDPVGTVLPDLPPVGDAWKKYVSTSTDSFITTNPESEARNSSPNVYRTNRTSPNNPNGVPTVIAPLSAYDSSRIALNQNATVSFKYYDSGSPNTNSLSLIINQATPGTVPTGLAAAGINFFNGNINQAGAGTLATYTANTWHDVKVDLNFATQRYALSVNDVVVAPSVAFLNSGRTTLTNLWFGHYAGNSLYYIDDVSVSFTPEPTSLATLALGSLLLGLTYRRRISRS